MQFCKNLPKRNESLVELLHAIDAIKTRATDTSGNTYFDEAHKNKK